MPLATAFQNSLISYRTCKPALNIVGWRHGFLAVQRHYNQLRAFVAVGECLSFSRAAEQLGVSPSALSQMLRGFEERIGVRLLNRTTRSVA